MAHYAYVEHEILEVVSGYRVALTYSLCWQNDGNDSGLLKSDEDIAGKMVNVIRRPNQRPYHIGLLLENKYSRKSENTLNEGSQGPG